MGNNKQLNMSYEQMKKIARYELTFDKLADGFPDGIEAIYFQDDYSYTLDDLKQALINMRQENPTVYDFVENWFYPLVELDEPFGLIPILSAEDDDDNIPEYLDEYAEYLPVSSNAQFRKIWQKLDFETNLIDKSKSLTDAVDLDELLSSIDRYEMSMEKPIEEWQFSEEEKENYILQFRNNDYLKNASENEIALCRKFIDELCGADSEEALDFKGYSCYGGNRLYACDWNASRDCITRLFDKTDNPEYANTLGYIYYYGRCNDGTPEYDKAFYYFSIAAANGLFEGTYKPADMFWHGYGCKKSARTAHSLYKMVYDDTLTQFLSGFDSTFADAALRMGNVFAKGIGEAENLAKAYYYYLQADYAIKLRAKNSDFFGDTTVAANIQNVIDEIKTKLPEDYFCDNSDYEYPFHFAMLTDGGNRCELKRSKNHDGSTVLTATRIAARGEANVDYILVTVPRMQYCERRKDVSYVLSGHPRVWFKAEAKQVRYNYFENNFKLNRYEFYNDDELVAYVKCDNHKLIVPAKSASNGKKYRLAGISFSDDGRTYDYICDLDDVKVGDTVVVEGYDGETEVAVTRLTTKRESELSLPLERYKKIVRKVR